MQLWGRGVDAWNQRKRKMDHHLRKREGGKGVMAERGGWGRRTLVRTWIFTVITDELF